MFSGTTSPTEIAVNTDFLCSTGSPEPHLRAIAEAGFTHLHWCHQWNTDFLYSRSEWAQYARWFHEFDLKLLDIHGSQGVEKCWHSPVEYERQAGVELVVNRIMMLRELGGTGSLMMHMPAFRNLGGDDRTAIRARFEALKRSLDELLPLLEKYDVRIAVENTKWDTFELIGEVMKNYPEKYFGITYDSGHGNIGDGQGLNHLEVLKNRLQALHLNDNDGGKIDCHQPPFYGTVDWVHVVKLLAGSSYKGRPLSFELSMRYTPFYEEELERNQRPERIRAFLSDAYERCRKVVEMFELERARKEVHPNEH